MGSVLSSVSMWPANPRKLHEKEVLGLCQRKLCSISAVMSFSLMQASLADVQGGVGGSYETQCGVMWGDPWLIAHKYSLNLIIFIQYF